MNYETQDIAVIGLGYVGLPLAVEFGKKRNVIGFDINKNRIAELCTGKDSTQEVEPDQLAEAKLLRYSHELDQLSQVKIFIITVPTPVDDTNRPDLNPLVKASQTVGRVISPGSIVIYESTVYPGATEEVCVPVLEQVSGLKFNKDFFVGYSPERINPGDKVNTLTKIKKITSGSIPSIATVVDELYASIITAGTHKAPSIKVAEAAKVIENTQRDLNIALINELSIIFERLKIDTLDVLEAAGTKWNFLPFRPGLVGGHCIGVDPYYLTHKAEQVGYNPQVILAGRRINDSMAKYIAQLTIKKMLENRINVANARVGIMGVTFKDNCPDIRNSKVIDLIRELEAWGVTVVVTDPWADAIEVKNEYGLEMGEISSKEPVDALVVAVAHQEFRAISMSDMRSFVRGDNPVLVDVKSIYARDEVELAGFSNFRI